MTSPRRFAVVAVPAQDESGLISECLAAVIDSAAAAIETGVLERVHIVVVAHRCTDDTARRSRGELSRVTSPLISFDVLSLRRPADVGEVRALAVKRGLRRLGTRASDTWIFSTDADSVVSPDWLSLGISEAERVGAVATFGMTSLLSWEGSPATLGAYEALIEGGLSIGPDGSESHTHVYGANLLVRADAYLAVGGFPPQGHGEDQRLATALLDAGHATASSRRWVVATSGRTIGRARHGLADLLLQFADAPQG